MAAGLIQKLARNVATIGKGRANKEKAYSMGRRIMRMGREPLRRGVYPAADTAALGYLGYEFVGKPVGQLASNIWNAGDVAEQEAELWQRSQLTLRAMEEKRKARQEAVQKNIQTIASQNPQLYNELIVGRSLPRGAIVLGGPPRTDLLETVASMMAGEQ